MKKTAILFVAGLALLAACESKPKTEEAAVDSAVAAIDSAAMAVDSATVGVDSSARSMSADSTR